MSFLRDSSYSLPISTIFFWHGGKVLTVDEAARARGNGGGGVGDGGGGVGGGGDGGGGGVKLPLFSLSSCFCRRFIRRRLFFQVMDFSDKSVLSQNQDLLSIRIGALLV